MIQPKLKLKYPTQFRGAFERLRQARGTSTGAELRRRGRIISMDCMRATPPFLQKGGVTKGMLTQSWNTQKRTGEKRTKRDVERVYQTLEGIKILAKGNQRFARLKAQIAAYARRGDFQKIQDILKNFGLTLPVIKVADPDVHKRARGYRGRVKGGPRVVVLNKASIGKLVKTQVAHVGKTKAGWVAGAKGLGATDIPNWITRHSTPGSISDRSGAQLLRQSIKVRNRVSWGNQLSDLAIVDKVVEINGRKMDREAREIIRGNLKKAMKQGGLGR